MSRFARPLPSGLDHLDELTAPLAALRAEAPRLEAWGGRLAGILQGGGRLLAAGNGGSAAQAAHLTAELVGRYRDDRPAFSAIALIAEPCALSAIGNDYGGDQIFARQVEGHGRVGDVLLCLSTSGRSPNLLTAVEAGRRCGLETWALCGRPGSPLERACDEALCVDAPHTATVQEVHLIAVHLLCAAFEHALAGTVVPLGLAEAR